MTHLPAQRCCLVSLAALLIGCGTTQDRVINPPTGDGGSVADTAPIPQDTGPTTDEGGGPGTGVEDTPAPADVGDTAAPPSDPGPAADAGEHCVSDPDCGQVGDVRCASAGAQQICAEVEPGCLQFGPVVGCPPAMLCGEGLGCACNDVCTDGENACVAAAKWRACEQTLEGCWVWSVPQTCANGGACEGAGVCADPCFSDTGCDAVGLTACWSSDTVSTCELLEPGCLKWSEPSPCGGTQTCSDGECVVGCESDCPATGALGCSATGGEQVCEEVQPGCNKWAAPVACPESQTCAAGSGCSCSGDCELGVTECLESDLVQACAADGAGCPHWEFVYCSPVEQCEAGACVPACVSDPGCVAINATRCATALAQQVCEQAAPGCLQWSAPEGCPAHQACSGGGCTCVTDPGCTEADLVGCAGPKAVHTCEEDSAGCLYWGAETACPPAKTCADGVCTTVCSSDLGCDSAGATQCAAEGLVHTCEEVQPGCFKWGQATACPPHQACAEGSGCACKDECAGGAWCAGGGAVVTCTEDAAGCLYEVSSGCAAELVCLLGQCAGLESPLVSCGSVTIQVADAGYGAVFVGGTFNEWDASQTPATLEADGVWRASFGVAAAGVYEYKLLIDDLWQLDPLNPQTAGSGFVTNNVVDVPAAAACSPVGGQQCATGGLQICAEVAGCAVWTEAPEPCTAPDTYCAEATCATFESPLVTASKVTITVKDKGYGGLSLAGDFTDPPWGVFLPLMALEGRWTAALVLADHPGLTVGEHNYKLRTDAELWFEDPVNPNTSPDGEGGLNSILVIQTICTDACAEAGSTACVDAGSEQTCVATGECLVWSEPSACAAPQACLLGGCATTPLVSPAGEVTFALPDPGGAAVSVAGDFTDPAWDPAAAAPLTLTDGVWTTTLAGLAPGSYAYKLIVDGVWQTDPHNPDTADDGFGGLNSVLVVP